VEGISVTGAT